MGISDFGRMKLVPTQMYVLNDYKQCPTNTLAANAVKARAIAQHLKPKTAADRLENKPDSG
jgi:hypothetical protein